MFKNKSKIFLSFLMIFFISPTTLLAQSKTCEIKYNEKGGAQTIERIAKIKAKYKHLSEKDLLDCYIIGLEHDENRKPIINKPIYACCINT